MYGNGDGVPKDEKLAIKLYQRACDGGEGRGCKNLGVMYENASGVAKDMKRAAELYEQACDKGDPGACVFSGDLYVGDQVGKDAKRAVAPFWATYTFRVRAWRRIKGAPNSFTRRRVSRGTPKRAPIWAS